jgi:hypothetical protein
MMEIDTLFDMICDYNTDDTDIITFIVENKIDINHKFTNVIFDDIDCTISSGASLLLLSCVKFRTDLVDYLVLKKVSIDYEIVVLNEYKLNYAEYIAFAFVNSCVKRSVLDVREDIFVSLSVLYFNRDIIVNVRGKRVSRDFFNAIKSLGGSDEDVNGALERLSVLLYKSLFNNGKYSLMPKFFDKEIYKMFFNSNFDDDDVLEYLYYCEFDFNNCICYKKSYYNLLELSCFSLRTSLVLKFINKKIEFKNFHIKDIVNYLIIKYFTNTKDIHYLMFCLIERENVFIDVDIDKPTSSVFWIVNEMTISDAQKVELNDLLDILRNSYKRYIICVQKGIEETVKEMDLVFNKDWEENVLQGIYEFF